MSKLKEAAEDLRAQIEKTIGEAASSKNTNLAAVKRALFSSYSTQWNEAEEADDKEALKVLEELRSKLAYKPQKLGLPSRVFMYVRLVLAVFVGTWGCMCILLVSPVRWIHPILRFLGVPNGWLPLDFCIILWTHAVLAAAGVTVKVEGESAEERWGRDCGIIVYNHASNLDPFIVSSACQGHCPKYVGKKILFKLPFFGWMTLATGMVPIDRGDREKAMKVMNQTVTSIMQRSNRSIAVAPEGTRTTDGHLRLPFKKGTFHTQEHTGAPLLPLAIHGAFELWPPGQPFTRTGEVTVRVLPKQPAGGKGSSREASRIALQRGISKTLGQSPELGCQPLSSSGAISCLLTLAVTAVVYRGFWLAYGWLIASMGLGVGGVIGLILLVSLVITLLLDHVL